MPLREEAVYLEAVSKQIQVEDYLENQQRRQEHLAPPVRLVSGNTVPHDFFIIFRLIFFEFIIIPLSANSGATNAPNGTTIKFNPSIASDTMMRNGTSQQINTKNFCITAMKEYEQKSFEVCIFSHSLIFNGVFRNYVLMTTLRTENLLQRDLQEPAFLEARLQLQEVEVDFSVAYPNKNRSLVHLVKYILFATSFLATTSSTFGSGTGGQLFGANKNTPQQQVNRTQAFFNTLSEWQLVWSETNVDYRFIRWHYYYYKWICLWKYQWNWWRIIRQNIFSKFSRKMALRAFQPFGSTQAQQTTGGGLFGQPAQQQQQQQSGAGLFGSNASTTNAVGQVVNGTSISFLDIWNSGWWRSVRQYPK